MNKLMIIGNLVRDPELRATQDGREVCNFTVAVNRRQKEENVADFFRVTVWDKKAQNCKKYLAKGRKVAVWGAVGVHTYTTNDGDFRAQLEVSADDVEFLTHKGDGYTQVNEQDNPFMG